jgi:hypothetical protein
MKQTVLHLLLITNTNYQEIIVTANILGNMEAFKEHYQRVKFEIQIRTE